MRGVFESATNMEQWTLCLPVNSLQAIYTGKPGQGRLRPLAAREEPARLSCGPPAAASVMGDAEEAAADLSPAHLPPRGLLWYTEGNA